MFASIPHSCPAGVSFPCLAGEQFLLLGIVLLLLMGLRLILDQRQIARNQQGLEALLREIARRLPPAPPEGKEGPPPGAR